MHSAENLISYATISLLFFFFFLLTPGTLQSGVALKPKPLQGSSGSVTDQHPRGPLYSHLTYNLDLLNYAFKFFLATLRIIKNRNLSAYSAPSMESREGRKFFYETAAWAISALS